MSPRLPRTRGSIHKRCTGCGRAYARDEWLALPFVGEQRDEVERVELRNCTACPTTIGISTLITRVTYSIEPTPIGDGWMVWRRVGNGAEVAYGFGARATIFRSEADASSVVRSQRRADASAATRLGVILVDDERAA